MVAFDRLDDRARQAVVALKALARVWGLRTSEQAVLAGVAKRTVERWSTNASVPDRNSIERVGALLRIYDGLAATFDEDTARTWIRRSNGSPLFHGRTPLDFMLMGGAVQIYDVLRHVEALRFA